MKRKPVEATFYALEDVARAWGCSVEQVLIYAEHGAADGRKLRLSEMPLAGHATPMVSHTDREAFERARGERMGAKERTSLLALVGVLVAGWTGGDERKLRHHYEVWRELGEWAARAGVPVLRGDDTNAALIRQAVELLAREGYVAAEEAISAREALQPPAPKSDAASENPTEPVADAA